MPQNKITILCTAAIDEEPGGANNTENICVDVIPFIRTERIPSSEVARDIERSLKLSKLVVFTSKNAVAAVAAHLDGRKPKWRIFCLGQATRQLVEQYFGKEMVKGTADNAKELAKVIGAVERKEVIFFCGDQRRDELPDALREKHIDVKEVAVYHTVAQPRKIAQAYDGILFFSPSAVKSFFQRNKLDEHTVLFAIGGTTASEIKKILAGPLQGFTNKIIIGRGPGKKTLLEGAITYFQTQSRHY